MNKFRRFAICFVLIEIILVVLLNLKISSIADNNKDKYYRVEISRILNKIEAGVAPEAINLDEYDYIVSVAEFVPEQIGKYDYEVKDVDGTLYKIEYSRDDNTSLRIIFNIGFAIIILISIGLFIYLDKKLLSPFTRMNDMTTELAKGNLAVPIKQERSKYFGKFIWGMDMLREKLEDDKTREMNLQKEKKTLILSLSHDIKTPLSAIELYAKALKSGLYTEEEKKQAALDGIEKNISEIKKYVGEIVEASREDFLALDVKNKEVYLKDINDSIAKYYAEKMKHYHVEFGIEEVGNCLIYGDAERIIEVLQNVIENALKYGDGKSINISFDEEENCKLISVSNTGCTIKDEELPHLFDSFYRGSNSEKVEGSGLGLYICKHLLHKMDGEIFAKTDDGRFTVTIVLRKA